MSRAHLFFAILAAVFSFTLPCPAQTDHTYKYFRVGNAADTAGTPHAGYALMGGGADLDEAFTWLCDRAGGGDLLVLRATGTDAYNPYIQKLCRVNSVATLVIPDRDAANNSFVGSKIREASAIFISGGDQAHYINFWMGTPVQEALNEAIARGVPMGGTSAGLAVLGEYAYSAQGDKPDDADLSGKMAMSDPFSPRMTLVHGFLQIPVLKGIITDTHFAKRDRMGRLLVFLARLNEPDGKAVPAPGHGLRETNGRRSGIRGIGVEQGAAVLVDPDGKATVVGHGDAYFVSAYGASGVVAAGKQLSFGPYAVAKVAPGGEFDLRAWSGEAANYALTVHAGIIDSTQAGGGVY